MFGIPTRRRAKAAGSPILHNVARDGLGRKPALARWREYAAQAGWWAAAVAARGLPVLATECAILLEESNESGRAQNAAIPRRRRVIRTSVQRGCCTGSATVW
jgi:hypothetical protein